MDESENKSSRKRSSISKAETLEAMSEFWDKHDFTEFDTDAPDVEFTFYSALNPEDNS